MGLFGSLLGEFVASQEQHSALMQEVGSVVNESGGVGGLAQQFEQKGLGDVMSGWIANNGSSISGEQIIDVLGKDRITAIASRAGLSEDQVAAGLTKLLPLVIHELAPNGTVPPHDPAAVSAAVSTVQANTAPPPPPASS
jgi:uncharacterized protein YidB (DUF937 family)